jgi:hypothetical protein
VKDLLEVIRLNPSAAAYFHLAQAQLQANDRERAKESWRKAQELGLNPQALHSLEHNTYQRLAGELNE